MNRFLCFFGLAILFLTGCQSFDDTRLPDNSLAVAEMEAKIQTEKPGNYWIGRRYFKKDFRFWGYVRAPGQPWKTARLVMINEQRKLVPDREAGNIGVDNNYEYILYGNFSGESVYEPPSNRFLPEFVLTDYRLISTNPPSIFPQGSIGANPYSTAIDVPR